MGFWRESPSPTTNRPRRARPSARAPAGPASRASGSPSHSRLSPGLQLPRGALEPTARRARRTALNFGAEGYFIFFFPMNLRLRTDAQCSSQTSSRRASNPSLRRSPAYKAGWDGALRRSRTKPLPSPRVAWSSDHALDSSLNSSPLRPRVSARTLARSRRCSPCRSPLTHVQSRRTGN